MNSRNKIKRRQRKENPFQIKPMGVCPVQAWGNLPNGEYYYFRSRHAHWRLEICESESMWWSGGEKIYLFRHIEEYGTDHQASWITTRQAIKFATKAIKIYLNQNP